MNTGFTSVAISILLTLSHHFVYCQDKIYLKESTKQGKIVGIESGSIQYKPTSGGDQTLSIPTQNVQLLFNQYGQYLLPGNIDFNSSDGKKNIETFLNDKTIRNKVDVLFKNDGSVFEGKIISEDAKTLGFQTRDSTMQLALKDIALIISANGSHRIVGTLDQATAIISQYRNASAISSGSNLQTKNNSPAEVQKTMQASVSSTDNPVKPLSIGEIVPGLTQADFTDKAVQKTTQLSNYLKLLCDKKSRENLHLIVDQAVSLFVNEEVLVQVSSVNNSEIQQIAIRNYLTKLTRISYDAVDIEWTKVQYVGAVRPNPDGTFSGTVSFEQKFTGYIDGQIAYEDITRKEAQVILKTYVKNVDGARILNWEVLLSDVKVISTKKTSAKS